MFGRQKNTSSMVPKMNKEHKEIREEVIRSRELLLKEIAKLEKKFDITHPRKKP